MAEPTVSAALLAACEHGHITQVRQLLEEGADIHSQEGRAFLLACQHGHNELVGFLLGLKGSQRIDVHRGSEQAFLLACSNGHTRVVQQLLALSGDRLIDISAKTHASFVDACANGHLAVVRELLALQDGRRVWANARHGRALRDAAKNGHVDVVCELLGLQGAMAVDLCQYLTMEVGSPATGSQSFMLLRQFTDDPTSTRNKPQRLLLREMLAEAACSTRQDAKLPFVSSEHVGGTVTESHLWSDLKGLCASSVYTKDKQGVNLALVCACMLWVVRMLSLPQLGWLGARWWVFAPEQHMGWPQPLLGWIRDIQWKGMSAKASAHCLSGLPAGHALRRHGRRHALLHRAQVLRIPHTAADLAAGANHKELSDESPAGH